MSPTCWSIKCGEVAVNMLKLLKYNNATTAHKQQQLVERANKQLVEREAVDLLNLQDSDVCSEKRKMSRNIPENPRVLWVNRP